MHAHGRCNGYQHLALLTEDLSLANETNLLKSSNSEDPKDFYSYIVTALKFNINNKINEINNVGIEHEFYNTLDSYKRIKNMNIPISLVKKPIMTRAYNASVLTMMEDVKNEFNVTDLKIPQINKKGEIKDVITFSHENSNDLFTNGNFSVLIKNIMEVLYKEFPKIHLFNKYLKDIAILHYNANIAIPWVLPSGLKVNQYYKDSNNTKIKYFEKSNLSFTIKEYNNNRINKAKQIRSLMPNLIHSLDAASLSLLTENLFNGVTNS